MENPESRCAVFSTNPSFILLYTFLSSLTLLFVVSCTVERQPKLKRRYRQHIEATIEYAKTIDDFNDLVDPRTLPLHCLGPEPSAYVLHTIEIEEKNSKHLLSSSLSFPFSFFQLGDVCKNEDQEERALFQSREEGGACYGEGGLRYSSYSCH